MFFFFWKNVDELASIQVQEKMKKKTSILRIKSKKKIKCLESQAMNSSANIWIAAHFEKLLLFSKNQFDKHCIRSIKTACKQSTSMINWKSWNSEINLKIKIKWWGNRREQPKLSII